MYKAEYELWLRQEMPDTFRGCELTDEQIQRNTETFEEDQIRQRRRAKHFEMIDVMANIRAQ